MIVTTTATIQKYLSVNNSFDYNLIKPQLKAAERDFLKPFLGADFISSFYETSNNEIITAAKQLLEESLCNYAYYLYLPLAQVQITSSGILVSKGDDYDPAPQTKINDLLRFFKSNAYRVLDEFIDHINQNQGDFDIYFQSEFYTKNQQLFVNQTSTFQQYYDINNSAITFHKLRPTLQTVEDQYILQNIPTPVLNAIKNSNNTIVKEVKTLLEKTIVAFTIATVIDNGAFTFTGDAFVYKFDVLPHETLKEIKADVLEKAKQNKQTEANNYLANAIRIIKNNPIEFPLYIAPVKSTENNFIVKKGGVVSI